MTLGFALRVHFACVLWYIVGSAMWVAFAWVGFKVFGVTSGCGGFRVWCICFMGFLLWGGDFDLRLLGFECLSTGLVGVCRTGA